MRKSVLFVFVIFIMSMFSALALSVEEAAFLDEINAATNEYELKGIVEENAQTIGLDLSIYNQLSTKTKVYDYLFGKNYTSIDMFESAFLNAVNQVKSSQSIGCGGGSGVGGGTYPVPHAYEYTMNNIAIKDKNNNIIDVVADGQSVKVSASFTKNADISDNPVVLIGVYTPQGTLVKVFMVELEGIAKGQTMAVSFPCVAKTDYYAKAFMWESMTNMKVVSKSIQKNFMEPLPENTTKVRGIITDIYDSVNAGEVKMTVMEELVGGVWSARDEQILLSKGTIDTTDMLGCYIEAFVQNLSSSPVLVKIPVVLQGNTAEFFAADIEGIVGTDISVNEDYNVTHYYVTENVKIYYNNVLQINMTVADVANYPNAEIRLQNNIAGATDYNVLFIDEYRDMIVDTINTSTKSIISSDNLKVIIDETIAGANFDIVKNGRAVTLADIKAGDVVSILGYVDEIKELVYGRVAVSANRITGILTSYDYDERYVIINNIEYKCNQLVVNRIENGELNLGDTVRAYLNSRNMVSDIKVEWRINLKYGFASSMTKNVGLSDTYQIRLMNTEGTWETLNFASTVAVNRKSKAPSAYINWNDEIGFIGESDILNNVTVSTDLYIINKVFAYEVNSARQITAVYFIPITFDEIFEYKKFTNAYYNESTGQFGSVYLNDNTVIFTTNYKAAGSEEISVPTDRRIDEDTVGIGRKDLLIDGGAYQNVYAYNMDENSVASVMFGKGLFDIPDYSANFLVVDGEGNTINNDGDEGVEIGGVIGGGEDTGLFGGAVEDIPIKP